MKITMETDYAVRIVYCLAKEDKVLDAGEICSRVGVSFRFALKILGKLCRGGVLRSFRGAAGGYKLADAPARITLLQVFEAIEGDTSINRCGGQDLCTWDGDPCPFHEQFKQLDAVIREKLGSVNFERKGATK